MESINRYRRKATKEGRFIISGAVLNPQASAILTAEREKGKSIAAILNAALMAATPGTGPTTATEGTPLETIQRLRSEGVRPVDIAKYLNAAGVPCGANGEAWTPVAVVTLMEDDR